MLAQKTVQRIIHFKAVSLAIASKVIFIGSPCHWWFTLKASTSILTTSFHDFRTIQNVASLVEHSDRSFAAITRCGSGGSCGPARHASGPSGLAWHTMPCIFLTAVLQNFRWFARYFKTWSHRLEQFCWPDWSFQAIAEGWGQLDDLDMKLKCCQTHILQICP